VGVFVALRGSQSQFIFGVSAVQAIFRRPRWAAWLWSVAAINSSISPVGRDDQLLDLTGRS
jgi:hypothetical protein